MAGGSIEIGKCQGRGERASARRSPALSIAQNETGTLPGSQLCFCSIRIVPSDRSAGRSVNSLRLRRRLLLCVLRTFTLDCKQVAHQKRRRLRFKRIVFPVFHRLPSAKPEVLSEPANNDVSSRCRSEAIPCHPFATQQFRCRKRKAKATAASLAMRKKCPTETK